MYIYPDDGDRVRFRSIRLKLHTHSAHCRRRLHCTRRWLSCGLLRHGPASARRRNDGDSSTSETSEYVYQTAWRNNAEANHLHNRHRENLKPHFTAQSPWHLQIVTIQYILWSPCNNFHRHHLIQNTVTYIRPVCTPLELHIGMSQFPYWFFPQVAVRSVQISTKNKQIMNGLL